MSHPLPLGATPRISTTSDTLDPNSSAARTDRAECEDAIDGVEVAADALGWAMRREMVLEDQRSLLKPIAVRRVMETRGLAATPAEKLVESDDEYMAHRKQQYECVVERMRADGAYRASRLRAELFVALARAGR